MLFRKFANLLDGIFEKDFSRNYAVKNCSAKYAVKNVCSIKLLQNISRLVALLTCLLMLMSIVIIGTLGHVKGLENLFSSEYVVLNATDNCRKKIDECKTVESNYGAYFYNAKNITVISAENREILDPTLKIAALPDDNEVIISKSAAAILGCKKGDHILYPIEERKCEFIVKDVINSAITFMLIDAEYFEVPYNMTMVNSVESASSSEVFSELSEKTALELASVSTTKDLFKEKAKTISVYINVGLIILVAMFIFSVIGISDNLYESYLERRDEFKLYRLSGMSQKTIRRMKLTEILISFTFGIAMGILGFIAALGPSIEGMRNVGYEVFRCFLYFFK